MVATTYTWTAGTSGDWSVKADWTPSGIPGKGAGAGTDVVDFNAGTSGIGGPYLVTVGLNESFAVGTMNLAGANNQPYPNLGILGSLTTGTLAYAPSASNPQATQITVGSGGLFDITSAITDSGSTIEPIYISGTSTGGHVELGSVSVNNSNVYFSFSNGSGPNTGELEFLSDYTSGENVSQHITNFAWGDRLVFDGANFSGAKFSYSGTTLTVTSGNSIVLTISNLTGPGLTSKSFVGSGDTISVVCFAAGTRILTAAGERTVESLEPEEMVLTLAGGELQAQPIKWVGRRRIDLGAHPHPETVAPVRIRRGAFADNVPSSDLLVSPDHAIFVDGKLICARQLINGATIRQEVKWPMIEYFHVELQAHSILLANGLAAESYLDTGNRGFFANSGEPLVLHPDLTDEEDHPSRAAGSRAPFVWDEANVRPVWERLATRAAALGRPVPRPAVTTDPDLHIVAKGRVVRPMYSDNGLHIFALPRGASEVRLVSRASSPTAVRPWMEDRRRLGVYVERIQVRSAHEVTGIPLDHPRLSCGWWAMEREGAEQRRWTDGDALVPLPALSGPAMLEVSASSGGMVYVAEPGATAPERRTGTDG